jgi:hypothetical protein
VEQAPKQNSDNPKVAADLGIPGEVFTFGRDLGKRGLDGGLTTG